MGNAAVAAAPLKECGDEDHLLGVVMKKIFLFLLVSIALVGALVWYLRYDILKFSLNTAIERSLPANVSIDRIVLDIPGGRVDIYGISAENPPGFREKDLFRSDAITARFRTRGLGFLRGLELTEIEVRSPRVFVERLRTGELNFESFEPAPPGGPSSRLPVVEIRPSPGKTERGPEKGILPDLSEALIFREPLPVKIEEGSFAFRDDMVGERPFHVMFGGVETVVYLRLDDEYQVRHLATDGYGFVNEDPSQKVRWRISADPSARQLRMSNRIEPENVDLVIFKPYFDRYAPVDISSARVSGTIVFDVHAGRIGSDNTLVLRDLVFSRRDPGRVSGFWDASITDIIRYLESAPGEVIFDFKIKGPFDSPRFYPGPNVTRALQSLAVDQVSRIIRGVVGPAEDVTADAAAPPSDKSDVERAIGIFQDLIRR